MLSVGNPLDRTVSMNTKGRLIAQRITTTCLHLAAGHVVVLLWMGLSVLWALSGIPSALFVK